MNASAVVRLADYHPYPFHVPDLMLDIALDPKETRVRSVLRIERREAGGGEPLTLDGQDLEFVSAWLDGVPLDPSRFEATPDRFVLHAAPDAFTLELEVLIRPDQNPGKKGLFWHAGVLATQCEAEGFRQITYFPDRPDVMTRYQVRLEADAERFPVLLSNGDLVEEGVKGGRAFALWKDPYPKPSYIFAVMAGEFGIARDSWKTPSGREIKIAIHARPGEEGRCRFALEALKSALAWEERTFGLEYDLDLYNIVALDDYSGAQENKGLNLFGAEGVIADPAITTDEEFSLIQRIIGHEYFHNWTGNRVTCRDWFQLSLKEGLTRLRDQLFMEDVLEPGAFRIEQVKALRRNQFPEDDGPAAHPVQPDSFSEIENFYTNTIYEKGAEVLRMLRSLVGPEAFAATIREYLATFDGQAVTMEDLFDLFARRSGLDLGLFRKWLKQAGRPTLTARGAYDAAARRYTLTLSQTAPDKPGPGGPLHIPVKAALFARDGKRLCEPRLLELKAEARSFVFEDVAEAPIPSILREFTALVSLDLDLADADLAVLALRDDDPFVAWNSVQDLMIRAIRAMSREELAGRSGEPPEAVLDLVARLLEQAESAPMLTALKLALPDEPVLSEGLEEISLDGHMRARARLRQRLAERCGARLFALHEALGGLDPQDRSAQAIGRRSLRCACLDLMLGAGGDAAVRAALDQIEHGPSMTERFEALSLIAHVDSPARRVAFESFYQRYKDQPLVIDKWFKAYALSRAPDAIDEIMALEAHPAFDIRNTARVVAFYGSLFRQNRVTFHDPSGKGYRFLGDRLLMMDQMGGGRPSYFTPQLDQWRRHLEPRRGLMKAELERLAATPGITARLREVVERALV